MKCVLMLALGISAGTLLVTAAGAQSPSQARGATATLHPGHQGHLSSGQTYPGKPATDWHDGDPYATGPGGYAQQQSGGANAQRNSTTAPSGN
ncbi:hypothetical protein EHS39_29435 [Ensifer sp. MPMI2T]|nr:hypothetical protein EHS39_29435 [Ensifer sp. MPMI2T]